MKAILLATILLTGCGSSSSDDPASAPETPKTSTLESGEAKDGAKGAKGDKGDSGPAGRDGVDGKDGKDAVTLSQTEWLDPVNGDYWYMGPEVSYLNASRPCTGSWKLPTRAQLISANDRGFGNFVFNHKGSVAGWTADFPEADKTFPYFVYIATTSKTDATVGIPTLAGDHLGENFGAFCVFVKTL